MLSENPTLKITDKKQSSASQSQDSISKYSRPYPLEERKTMNSNPLELGKDLPLEEDLNSLLQRLHEAQVKSIQNRMNILRELTKDDKALEKEVGVVLKEQDDLIPFFTNNGELRTLNEENLEEIEKTNMIKIFEDIPAKKPVYETYQDIGIEGFLINFLFKKIR